MNSSEPARGAGTNLEGFRTYLVDLQERICRRLAALDGKSDFTTDRWEHTRGGGGITRVIRDGAVFEKGAVSFSFVTVAFSPALATKLGIRPQPLTAAGISIILHPLNPYIPTVHMNLRLLAPADAPPWFGGGIDLTPYYINEEDIAHFHRTLRAVCDRHNPDWYPRFKRQCDDYFRIAHRQEGRGVGGIFFDYEKEHPESFVGFVRETGDAFLEAYLPIVERRRNTPWGERERRWQLVRRGRYVEFNLVYDRGTVFGLETGGRIESVLVSLPPEVRWEYDFHPEPGSEEEKLTGILRHPKEWA